MTTTSHSWRNWSRETDGAAGTLGLSRHQHLEHRVPIQMNVGIGCLRVVISIWRHDESVIGVYVASLVHRMVSGAGSPCRIAPRTARWRLILRAWRKRKVHQMGDGRLSFSASCRSHDGLEHTLGQSTRPDLQKHSGHSPIRCTRHPPATAVSAAFCVGSSAPGCSSAQSNSEKKAQLQSFQSPLHVAASRCRTGLPNGRSQARLTYLGDLPLSRCNSVQHWKTSLNDPF